MADDEFNENETTSLLGGKSSFKKDYTLEISSKCFKDALVSSNSNSNWRKRFNSQTNQLTSTTYTWKDVNVWVGPELNMKEKKFNIFSKKNKPVVESRQILTNVSGIAKAGELLGILGSSGAGKTTFLNVLTFRNTKNLQIHGERWINGVPAGPDVLTALSAYIQQNDIFIGTLTVREHLIFQALLRMEKHMSYSDRTRRVDQVMQEVGLTKCRDTLIGITGRISGISGGEKKRLAFASEVLTDPLLLFCDEPTSGLDSYMAQNVVQVLKEMAKKGKSIVTTIHQPSSEIFELFDRVILMAEGRVAFAGTSLEALTFFSGIGLTCPLHFNPADYFIEVLAVLPGNEVETRSKIKEICAVFEKSSTGIELQNVSQEVLKLETGEFLHMELAMKNQSKYKSSWLSQFRAVYWRSCLTLLKEPMLIRVRIYQTFVVAILFGFIFYGQKLNQNGIMNISGVLFIYITSLTFQNVFGVVDTFSSELPIFLREHFNGMYRTDVYFLSKTFAELPMQILYPVLFNSICYYMIGLNPNYMKFLYATLICILISNITCSFGYMLSCMSPSPTVSITLAAPTMLPLMIFGGYFLNKRSIPSFLSWLKYLSWFLYGYEALNINQWENINEIECDSAVNSTCLSNGPAVLNSLHFEKDNFNMQLVALAALFIGFRVMAFLALLLKTIRRK